MRLRQLVLAAHKLEPLASQLQEIFDLGEGYNDPNIIDFGLENIVIPVGDTFLEIVAPAQESTTAGRYLERRGPGGYMVIVQIPDTNAARHRFDELGMRIVWQSDHDAIDGTHLHPKDTGGAILSLDEARPRESWQWAGPGWEEHSGRTRRVRQLIGATLQSPNPRELAERWSAILARPLVSTEAGQTWRIQWDGEASGFLQFEQAEDDRGEGLSEFWMLSEDQGAVIAAAKAHGIEVEGTSFLLGGIRFHV